MGFHECQYYPLVKPHACNCAVILRAPLGVFAESYRLLRVNRVKELVVVRV